MHRRGMAMVEISGSVIIGMAGAVALAMFGLGAAIFLRLGKLEGMDARTEKILELLSQHVGHHQGQRDAAATLGDD